MSALIEEVRFAMDSPVEGTGFEPSVPLLGERLFRLLPKGDAGPKARWGG
jgi:hypothetical protein